MQVMQKVLSGKWVEKGMFCFLSLCSSEGSSVAGQWLVTELLPRWCRRLK